MGSKLQCSVILFVMLSILTKNRTSSEKVLLIPTPGFESHWFVLAKIGQALVNRGHVVTVLLPQDIVDKRRSERPDFSFETFQDQGTAARIKELIDHNFAMAGQTSVFQVLQAGINMTGTMTKHCDLLLKDSTLVDRLRALQYRVVISDPIFPCGALMAARVDPGLPNVAVLRYDVYFQDVTATGVPHPLSYVTSVETDLTDQMTFSHRLQNVGFYSLVHTARRWLAGSVYDGVAREYLGEGETTQSVMSRTALWLYRTDLVLDFPRPTMPNMVQVGGLNVGEDLEAFMQSSGENGVIVVSFGSVVMTMRAEQIEIFAEAFSRLRQKVVWRYTGDKPAGLGNNTKLMAWLPQNDLLGHPKTRVFVTHAGYNGLSEALHHGVPMVCLPQFADQPGNAARVVARGLGVKLDISAVTTDQLYQAIRHVLTNNRDSIVGVGVFSTRDSIVGVGVFSTRDSIVGVGVFSTRDSIVSVDVFSTKDSIVGVKNVQRQGHYRETAARLSCLHHDQPQSPMERAVWWIEHVIQHGGLPHLRARAVELPWYQYYLLDVAAFLLSACSAVLGTVWCGCSFVCRKLCCKTDSKLKSQ
ncbi:UDP-glucuronosyltransferase 2A1 [Branchiostoma belcheri]|nr:UDP-glucuronosyltransferase 2A1 [Branchiostoma belcheri]